MWDAYHKIFVICSVCLTGMGSHIRLPLCHQTDRCGRPSGARKCPWGTSTPTTHKLSPSFVGSVLVLDGPPAFLTDRPEAGPYNAFAMLHLTYKQ